jgi:hypothetical protein
MMLTVTWTWIVHETLMMRRLRVLATNLSAAQSLASSPTHLLSPPLMQTPTSSSTMFKVLLALMVE